MLLNIRWGNQVTEEDRVLVKYMTFFELLGSSFVTPKTFVTKDMVSRQVAISQRLLNEMRERNQQMIQINADKNQLPVNSVF